MSERVPAQNKTSATPPQATQASSPLLHRHSLTDEQSESLGGNSNISKELRGIQPKTIRRSLNWQNISVEAPSRGNGMSLPGGIQRQQEEPSAVSGDGVSADSVQKSPVESSNSTKSTEKLAQKRLAHAPFNGRNIPVEAPPHSATSSTYPGGIQRLATSGVKEQEKSTESLQMQPLEEIQVKSSEGQPQEKEEQNKELVQTKLTVGAPGDKYEQEADSMAAKVMTMPDSAIQQPIQRQTGEETEGVQMQPLVNSITPLVQRSSGKEEEVQMKSGLQQASDGSSQASSSIESRLASSKGGGSALPKDVLRFMEPRFGADFSSVQVHTDSNAVQMNKELGAQAFAHGSDIYFGAGKSPENNELTAHELTHVVQQTGRVPDQPLQLKPRDASRRLQSAVGKLKRQAGGQGEVDGSGEWGHDAKDRKLTDRADHYKWTRVALAAELGGLTNAARHMRHYLGNTGNPLTVNVNNMMRDVPDLTTAYSKQLTLAKEAANKKIAQMGNITKTQSFQVTGEQMTNVYCDKEISADWFYAIGGFTYWYNTAEGTVVPTKDGKVQVQMMYTLHVYDRYNWDKVKSVNILGIQVKDEELGRLHRVGLAREYEINGTSTPRRIEWNYSSSSPTADPANVPKGKDRDGGRSDPSRDRGRHFDNVRGSSGSNR
jgi:hypothetical protein